MRRRRYGSNSPIKSPLLARARSNASMSRSGSFAASQEKLSGNNSNSLEPETQVLMDSQEAEEQPAAFASASQGGMWDDEEIEDPYGCVTPGKMKKVYVCECVCVFATHFKYTHTHTHTHTRARARAQTRSSYCSAPSWPRTASSRSSRGSVRRPLCSPAKALLGTTRNAATTWCTLWVGWAAARVRSCSTVRVNCLRRSPTRKSGSCCEAKEPS
jgi:hypothetical protein